MNASLHDLKSHADGLTPPPLDLDEIVARGDARLGRRRAALAAGTAGLAVAVVAATMAFTGSGERSGSPSDDPTPTVSDTPVPGAAVRPLTYAEVPASQAPHWRIASIQYGEEVLRLGRNLHLDLTDDGLVVVSEDGTLYFWDGREIHEIGEVTLEIQQWSDSWVKTSPSGSLVAWFTPEGADRQLVVYDTGEQQQLAAVDVSDCEADKCSLVAIVGDRVYWTSSPRSQSRMKVLDIRTGVTSDSDASALSDDVRAQPRGFVKGDSFATGEAVNQDVNTEAVFFHAVGASLELSRFVREDSNGDGVYAYGGFDTTGRRLHLRLPSGYTPAESDYTLFQWLDDDRFAVMAGAAHNEFGWNGFRGYGDILVCDIAEESCTLAVPGPSDDGYRIVPHLDVPN